MKPSLHAPVIGLAAPLAPASVPAQDGPSPECLKGPGAATTRPADEGEVYLSKQVVDDAPEWEGTNRDRIAMLGAAHMAAGPVLEETRGSIIALFRTAEFGARPPETGKADTWLQRLRGAGLTEGEKTGEAVRHSSAMTRAAPFQQRVWGKIGARQDFQQL